MKISGCIHTGYPDNPNADSHDAHNQQTSIHDR